MRPDALQVEAEAEFDLLWRAAAYLEAELAHFRAHPWTVAPGRLDAIAREQKSIEWDAWLLGCALADYIEWRREQHRPL